MAQPDFNNKILNDAQEHIREFFDKKIAICLAPLLRCNLVLENEKLEVPLMSQQATTNIVFIATSQLRSFFKLL